MYMKTPQGEVEIVSLNKETYDMMLEALPSQQKTLAERAKRDRKYLREWLDGEFEKMQGVSEGAKGDIEAKNAEIAALRVQIDELGRLVVSMREVPQSRQEIE